MNIQAPIKPRKTDIHYPERDGKPMGETDVHRRWIMWLIIMLQHYYEHQEVYVTGDLLFYYEEGNPRRYVVPDVFVVRNHPPGDRRVYKLWEEGRAPEIVFEITSPSTKTVDLNKKMELYADLGVREYFLFDPLDEYLRPPLQGYRLVEDTYRPIPTRQPNTFDSEVLNLTIRLVGRSLELIQANGQRLLTPDERIEQEARRAEQEARRAEQEAQRAAQEAQRAEQEAQRAEQEAQRAEQEATQRAIAEARAAQLEAELAALRRQLGDQPKSVE
jgi:Uma2 family endonuclease